MYEPESHDGKVDPGRLLQTPETFMTEQINSLRRRYARAHKAIEDMVDVWTHGIASYAGIVAVGVTSYVRTQLAYRTAGEESGTILFSSGITDNDTFEFPWQAAAVIDVGRAHNMIFEFIGAFPYAETILDNISKRMLYNFLMAVLLSTDFKGDSRIKQGQSLVKLLRDILRLPEAFAAEVSILEQMENADTPTIIEDNVESINSRLPEMLMDDSLSILVDRCPISGCGQAIGWESIDEANCLNGHPLGGRCSITFLPILAPGLSKRCSDCCCQFLNELAHPDLIDADSPSDNELSIARLLLQWFDTCPYCGGKFFTGS